MTTNILQHVPLIPRLYASLRFRILAAARAETISLNNLSTDQMNAQVQALRNELGLSARQMSAHVQALQSELGSAQAQLRMLEAKQSEQGAAHASMQAMMIVHEAFVQGQAALGAGTLPQSDLVISVVLPTYNRAHCLPQAIASVRAQTYPHWQLIVIDDGSTDDTADVVAAIPDDRIVYVKQAHRGHSAARNHALRIATGDVVCYLDSDNIFFPAYLTTVAFAFANNDDLKLAYGALLSDHHGHAHRIKFQPFDHEKLQSGNYIDMNVVAHRRELVAQIGGFDESLSRLADWDLVLRYSKDHPPALLPVLAARYNADEANRVSVTNDYGANFFRVWQRWRPTPALNNLKMLYVVWHYPQLSESYIEAEIQGLLKLGVQIEVWREVEPVSPYPTVVRVHDGPIDDAITSFQPDVIHVHWLGFALSQEATLARLDRPVTVRLHGFEVTRETLTELLRRAWVARIYAFPHQLALTDTVDPRIRPLRSVFDTSLFTPEHDKDRRMILRTAAALESKDLAIMFELARRLPDFRIVLAVVTCNHKEHYVQVLRDQHRDLQSRVELMVDVPRDEIARLMKRAAIYVQTARRPGQDFATPIGMPIGIAEAMATGCYVLAPDLPEFASYLAGTNALYSDADAAVKLIEDTRNWTDRQWMEARITSIDLAFGNHADERVLWDVVHDLCELSVSKVKETKILH